MPQLQSGRHVGLNLDGILNAAREGHMAVLISFRLGVRTLKDLADLADIIGFEPSDEFPFPGKPFRTGLLVKDLRAGHGDWSPSERKEFLDFVDNDSRMQEWLAQRRDEIEQAIRSSSGANPDDDPDLIADWKVPPED